MPLIRTPRTLPKVLSPVEVDALVGVLRTHRDRAMVSAMLLGGLRRCEVLGVRIADVRAGERRLFIAEGKGGHQRIVPVSHRFFTSLADYFEQERPATDAEQVFVVLRGPNRGRALTADSTAIFGLEATLSHAGVIDELPRKRGRTKAGIRAEQWAKVSEQMRATMHSYLELVATMLRPGRGRMAGHSPQSLRCLHGRTTHGNRRKTRRRSTGQRTPNHLAFNMTR